PWRIGPDDLKPAQSSDELVAKARQQLANRERAEALAVYSPTQVETLAALVQSSASISYPDAVPDTFRASGLYAYARACFVVNADGRVDQKRLCIWNADHPVFEAAVRSAIPRLRFKPALIGSRRVRQAVELLVEFDPQKRAARIKTQNSESNASVCER